MNVLMFWPVGTVGQTGQNRN